VSSTCFEYPSVHPQEDLYMQFYGISSMHPYICSLVDGRMCFTLAVVTVYLDWYKMWRQLCLPACFIIPYRCILHILPSTRLLIWMYKRNTIKLYVQVFLRMTLGCSKHVKDTIIKLKH